jgi:hypothetical protein
MYPHQCGRVEFLHMSPHVNGVQGGKNLAIDTVVVETLYESRGILPFGGAQDLNKRCYSVFYDNNMLISKNLYCSKQSC